MPRFACYLFSSERTKITLLVNGKYITDWDTIRSREEKRKGIKELTNYIINM